jgi:hypothetical protein
MSLLRTRIREGSRFTIFDIDPSPPRSGARRCWTGRSAAAGRHACQHHGRRPAAAWWTWPSRCRGKPWPAARTPAGPGGALTQALPWLAEVPGAGVHWLNVSAGGGPMALLSQRTRLTLRLPRAAPTARRCRARPARGRHGLALGEPRPARTAAARHAVRHLVAAPATTTKLAFLHAVQAELAALGVACRAICGRHQWPRAARCRATA